MTPRTPPGRHPAGRTLAGSGANRGNGCLPRVAVYALVALVVVFLGNTIGHAFDGKPGPITTCCKWEAP